MAGPVHCPVAEFGQSIELTGLPNELLSKIAEFCYEDKSTRLYHNGKNARRTKVVCGGLHELAQVNKQFHRICLPIQFRVISITAFGSNLADDIRNFVATKSSLLTKAR